MPPRKPLDVAALQAMAEPLTVRVERVSGSLREPIPLPDAPSADYSVDDPPPCSTVATGWNVDNVRALESWILQWTGGGYYQATITDANGQNVEWAFNYSQREHKSKPAPSANAQQNQAASAPSSGIQIQPPPSAIAHAMAQGIPVQQALQPQQTVQQPQVMQMTYDNNGPLGGLPPTSAYMQPSNGQVPMQPVQPLYYPQMSLYPQTARPLPPNATPDQRIEAENRLYREQLAAMQQRTAAQEAQAAIAAAEMRHRDELRQIQAQHEKEMQQFREQFAQLSRPKETDIVHAVTSVVEQAFGKLADVLKPRDDGGKADFQRMLDDQNRKHEESMRALREEQARKDADAQRERDRLETQRREDQIRAEMRENALRMEKMIEKLSADNAARPTGPDPMIMLMQQIMQTQADAMKQVAAQQTMSTQQLAQFMMPPAQMVAMLKDTSSTSENLLRGIDNAYANVMSMTQAAVQNLLQMQPQGGSPVVEAVQTIAEKAGKAVDRWAGIQEQAVIQNAKTQQTVVQAQADVAKAQIQAQQPGQQQPQQAPAQLPAPSMMPEQAPTNGANGTHVAPPTQQPGTVPMGPKRHGRTDDEWFMQAMPHVADLREGARVFCESLAMDPWRRDPKGNIVGLTPAMAARGLQGAAAQIIANKLDIPAFTKLYVNDQFADLMDILLPPEFGIHQEYRDLLVKYLTRQLDPSNEPAMFSREAEEGEDDEEEPSEEEMRETDGAATPKRSSTSGAQRPASA